MRDHVDRLRHDVGRWVDEVVSKHSDPLGSEPCPFAASAMARDEVDWAVAFDARDLSDMLASLPSVGLAREVLVVGMDPARIDHEVMSRVVDGANRDHLMPIDLVGLEDHPDRPEVICGVAMNQGTWALVLVQRLSKLNEASRMLAARGYYRSWTQVDIDDVVTWRLQSNPWSVTGPDLSGK